MKLQTRISLLFSISFFAFDRALSQQFSRTPIVYDLTGLSEACAAAINAKVDECDSLRVAIGSDRREDLVPQCQQSQKSCLKSLQIVKDGIVRECPKGPAALKSKKIDEMRYGLGLEVTDGVTATWLVDTLSTSVELICKGAVVYPDAPGTIKECSKYRYTTDTKTPLKLAGKTFHLENSMNSCWFVLAEENITPEQLLEWNPSLDSGLARCALQPGLRYCVKKRIPILKTLFRLGWKVYTFVSFCRSVLRIFW